MTTIRAQHLDTWIGELEGDVTFTVHEYAAWTEISTAEASANITSFLRSQRRPGSTLTHTLHRKEDTRTTSAVWVGGVKTSDARSIGKATSSDFKRRIDRAFAPDLRRIAEKNPRAARQVSAQLTATLDGLVAMLDAALTGMSADE